MAIPATARAPIPATSLAAAPVKVAMGALAVALDQVATGATGLEAGTEAQVAVETAALVVVLVQAAQVLDGVVVVVQADQVSVAFLVVAAVVVQLSHSEVVLVVVEVHSDHVSVAFLVVVEVVVQSDQVEEGVVVVVVLVHPSHEAETAGEAAAAVARAATAMKLFILILGG